MFQHDHRGGVGRGVERGLQALQDVVLGGSPPAVLVTEVVPDEAVGDPGVACDPAKGPGLEPLPGEPHHRSPADAGQGREVVVREVVAHQIGWLNIRTDSQGGPLAPTRSAAPASPPR